MLAGTVMLGDLDDFIVPAQACVNPLFVEAPKAAAAVTAGDAPKPAAGAARITIASDFLGGPSVEAPPLKRPDLIKLGAGKTARISLNDCLACSGCVTSAETVLITQQSTGEMLRALADPAYSVFVVSFSPQSLASLAAHYGIADTLVAYGKLVACFRALGFHHVIDTTVGGELALAEACDEFVARLRRQRARGAAAAAGRGLAAAPPASVALSATRLQAVSDTTADGVAASTGAPMPADAWDAGAGAPSDDGPLLASACPGWVCYAEKTVPEALPHLSRVRSPQQATGAVVKQLLTGGALVGGGPGPAALAPSAVYHVSVMPCYDKKLEASRRDFFWEACGAKEVDCVLTTGEVVELLAAGATHLPDVVGEVRAGLYAAPGSGGGGDLDGGSLAAPAPPHTLEQLLTGVTRDGAALVGHAAANASSDAYLECALRAAARELHGMDDDAVVVEYEAATRNADFREACVRAAPGGPPLVRGALAYGFRNIQTVVSRMRRGRAPWDFVEIMACPAGCANGGGQAKPVAGAADAAQAGTDAALPPPPVRRELADAGRARVVDIAGRLHARLIVRPGSSPAVEALRRALMACTGGGASTRPPSLRLLGTRFHHVPKLEAAAIKW